jgi:hypothetical protein
MWQLTPFLVTGYLQHREGLRKELGKVIEDPPYLISANQAELPIVI